MSHRKGGQIVKNNSEIKRIVIDILNLVEEKQLDQMDCFFLPEAQGIITSVGECGSWPLMKSVLQNSVDNLNHVHIDYGNYFETKKNGFAEVSVGVLVIYKDDTGGVNGISATVLLKMIRIEEQWKISNLLLEVLDTIPEKEYYIGWHKNIQLPAIISEYDASWFPENECEDENQLVEMIFAKYCFMIGTHSYYIARELFEEDAQLHLCKYGDVSLRDAIKILKLDYPISKFQGYPVSKSISVKKVNNSIEAEIKTRSLLNENYYHMLLTQSEEIWKIKKLIQGEER